MSLALRERLRTAFAPPQYLSLPLAGVDLSTSGVKAVRLREGVGGLTLGSYTEARFEPGVFSDGEIIDQAAAVQGLTTAARAAGITSANVALPESKAYLFEVVAPGSSKDEWSVAVEQRIDELIPLPPQEVDFDIVPIGPVAEEGTPLVGVGFAKRIVDGTLSVADEVGIEVRALEGETFATARALLPRGDTSTSMIIDVGKSTTKLSIIVGCIPRFATTIGIGGHAFTLAVQKHFGVTESEARRVKYEKGILPTPGNEDYLAAMFSTVSAIRDEISRRLEYWQNKTKTEKGHEPISRAILSGGNASMRGLPEYLEGTLKIPVLTGDVFTNLASRDTWIPQTDYTESLAYATAIGLALRDHTNGHG